MEVVSGNKPVPGVQVRLYVREPADLRSFPAQWSGGSQGETGATGRWAVAAAPGSYYVTARLPGRAPGYATVVHPPGPVRTQVQVRLEEGAEAYGLVLEKGTHEPISFAEVVFTPPAVNSISQGNSVAPEDERLVATTSETGEFRLPYLAPGRYRIEARAPGYAPAVLPSAPVPFGGRITLMLKPGGQLEGVVLRADGQPAAGAEVLADNWQHGATVRTDSAGQFSFELPPGSYTVSARSGEEAGVLKGVAVAVGQLVQGVRVQLGAGARITGKVVRKDGSPVLGARVETCLIELGCDDLTQHRQVFAGTDESGAFSLAPLAADLHSIRVLLPGGGRLRLRQVKLAAGEHSDLTFHCEPTDDLVCQLPESEAGSPHSTRASVQGRVLHSRGLPVRNVIMDIFSADPAQNGVGLSGKAIWAALQKRKATSYEFLSDRFELHGLALGPRMIIFSAEGMRASVLVDVRPGEHRDMEVTVSPAVSMRGRLIDAATHQPLDRAWMYHPLSSVISTGKDGRFALRALPAGEQLLLVLRNNPVRTATLHIVKLTTGPENDVGDIEVPAP
ncbi:MAG TPA: carboxypeptidase-like regulatory domain-containing protein [Hyalangium sp.]|nr:carboxypeptidase-like regulatory domain-containing protein [Hyalangium sp.]